MPLRPALLPWQARVGSGKTTLGMMALGFLEPSNGEILYKGKPLSSMNRQEQTNFRKEVQAVFQDPFAVYNPFYKVDHIFEVGVQNFNFGEITVPKRARRSKRHWSASAYDRKRRSVGFPTS